MTLRAVLFFVALLAAACFLPGYEPATAPPVRSIDPDGKDALCPDIAHVELPPRDGLTPLLYHAMGQIAHRIERAREPTQVSCALYEGGARRVITLRDGRADVAIRGRDDVDVELSLARCAQAPNAFDQFRLVAHAELSVDRLQVIADRVLADVELFRDGGNALPGQLHEVVEGQLEVAIGLPDTRDDVVGRYP